MCMKKILKTIFAIVIIMMLILNYTMVFANPPEKPSGEMPGASGGTPPDKPDDNGVRTGANTSSHQLQLEVIEVEELQQLMEEAIHHMEQVHQ